MGIHGYFRKAERSDPGVLCENCHADFEDPMQVLTQCPECGSLTIIRKDWFCLKSGDIISARSLPVQESKIDGDQFWISDEHTNLLQINLQLGNSDLIRKTITSEGSKKKRKYKIDVSRNPFDHLGIVNKEE